MHAVHLALNQSFSVKREQALIVSHLHMSFAVRKRSMYLANLPHLEGLRQSFHDSLDQYELVEMRPRLVIVSCDCPLLLPCIDTDLWPVYTDHVQPWF